MIFGPTPTSTQQFFDSIGKTIVDPLHAHAFKSWSIGDGDVRMVLEGFMPEGTNLFGGLSGHGKTWIVLSIVRA